MQHRPYSTVRYSVVQPAPAVCHGLVIPFFDSPRPPRPRGGLPPPVRGTGSGVAGAARCVRRSVLQCHVAGAGGVPWVGYPRPIQSLLAAYGAAQGCAREAFSLGVSWTGYPRPPRSGGGFSPPARGAGSCFLSAASSSTPTTSWCASPFNVPTFCSVSGFVSARFDVWPFSLSTSPAPSHRFFPEFDLKRCSSKMWKIGAEMIICSTNIVGCRFSRPRVWPLFVVSLTANGEQIRGMAFVSFH